VLSNNLDAIISFIMMAGTAIGAWIAGKRNERGGALGEAASTIQILQAEIASLKRKLQDREQELAEMRGRLLTLEDLVTQRADVEGVRQVVDRIAEALGHDQS
jgi:FtsZ-binding cell division protein ZapB